LGPSEGCKPKGMLDFEDSAPSSAGKRKRQGVKGPRAAKRALVLREESMLPSILDQGVGTTTLGGACAHEEPSAKAGLAAARALQQLTPTPEKSLNLGLRTIRGAVRASATNALFPPQLPSSSAAKCQHRGFDEKEQKHSRINPNLHTPDPLFCSGFRASRPEALKPYALSPDATHSNTTHHRPHHNTTQT
jgi:hypothetical protein